MMSYKQEVETRLNNGADKFSQITEKSVAASKADAKNQEPLYVKLEAEGKKTTYRYTERGKEILLAAYQVELQKNHGMKKIECAKKVAKKYGVPVTYPSLDTWYRADARKKKSAVSAEKKVCPKCGKSVPEDDFMFCPFCGSKFETEKERVLRNAENVVNLMSIDKGNEAVAGIILDLVKYVKEH